MFLSPFFLIAGLVGASIPLVLHLMQNRRREQLPFPTLRFLKIAEKQSSSRIRMENLILWLIRTLIMLLLGLAFAMPVLRRRGLGFLGEAPRDVAIVLDSSYSMNYQSGRDTVWKKATDTARAIIEGLGENDRICLYLAADQPRALIAEPVPDKEHAASLLKGLEPGYGSSNFAPALTSAIKALLKDKRAREREVHLITDNQALPWQNFGGSESAGGEGEWTPRIVDKQTSIFVTLLGVPEPQNVAPKSIEILPGVVRSGYASQVTAHLAHTGLAGETTVTLFLDNKEIGRRSITAGSSSASPPQFVLPSLTAGIYEARVETPEDSLALDDAFHFLVRVEDNTTALCVGNREDTLFVRTALRSGGGGASAVKVIPPGELADENLFTYPCVFLCNALPLSGQALSAVERYVKTGGLVVIFPGLNASIESYSAWNCLPGEPSAMDDLPRLQRDRTLTWDKPRHPLIEPLRQGSAIPNLAVRRALVWDKPPDEELRLISMGPQKPFLLDRAFGEGHVLLFAVAADRTWSDFPLSPFFLPIIAQCVDYGSGFGSAKPYIDVTRSLSLSDTLPEFVKGMSLRDPSRASVPIRSSVVDGQTVLIAEDLTRAGIYSSTSPTGGSRKPALAVNLDRRESDLTPIVGDGIAKRVRVPRLEVATDQKNLFQLIEEQRVGRTYGEHLLWIAFLLIVIEFVYANFRVRSKPRLSDQLQIDEAGSLRGHITSGS